MDSSQINLTAFTLGKKAKELLVDLQRSDWLPEYNENGIKEIIGEINELHAAAQDLQKTSELVSRGGENDTDIDSSLAVPMLLYNECILRNRRCMMTYLTHRVDKLLDRRFEVGAILDKDDQDKLSASEKLFWSNYNKKLDEYMTNIELDLTSNLLPPKGLMIEVRALQDIGEVMTENGPVVLLKDNIYLLKRADVEQLVKQNLVKQL